MAENALIDLAPQPDFAALFAALPHACLVFTPDLVIVAASDAYLDVTMTRREDLVGRELFVAFPNNGQGTVSSEVMTRTSIAIAIETGRPHSLYRQRYDLLRPEADPAKQRYEERYWNITNHPVRQATNTVRWIIQTVTDVTAEVMQDRFDDDRLQSAEARFAATFEQDAVGIVIISPEGRILEANQRFSDLVGFHPAELRTKFIRDITHPDDLTADIRATEALQSRTATRHSVEKRYIHRNGSAVWVKKGRVLVRTASGQPSYFIGVVEDISTRKAAQVTLREQEAYFRSILETVPDGMIVIDAKGLIHSFSRTAEKLFGYKPEEVIGQNVSMLMPMPDRSRHDSYIKGYLDTTIPRIIGIGRVVTGCRRDGSEFPLHLSIGEIQLDNRRMFVGFTRDLTDRERAEARLQALQSELVHMSRFTALGEMASVLAHELNQPLTAATNYLKGAHRVLQQGAEARLSLLTEAVNEAAAQTLRAGQIIRRLRDFVARGEGERQDVNLRSLIEEASALALIGAGEQGVRVFFSFDPTLSTVYADRIQIQQVLLNLIRNAIEAMQDAERRELTIETAASSERTVRIEVRDTGPGLAPEVAAKLFQPFVTTKPTGMGVGLSICRTIIEAHEGEIVATSDPGTGTTFRLILPALSPENRPHA